MDCPKSLPRYLELGPHPYRSMPRRKASALLYSGSVFCEAAFAAAKYALEYSGRKKGTQAWLTLHKPELLLTLTKKLVGDDGSLVITAVMDSSSTNSFTVAFKVTSAGASHELGSCVVKFRDPSKTQAD